MLRQLEWRQHFWSQEGRQTTPSWNHRTYKFYWCVCEWGHSRVWAILTPYRAYYRIWQAAFTWQTSEKLSGKESLHFIHHCHLGPSNRLQRVVAALYFLSTYMYFSLVFFFLFDQYRKFKSTGNEVYGHWGIRPVYVSLCEHQDYSACQQINLPKSKHWKTTQNHHYQTMRGWVKARYRTG